ncbi:MAG: hypothetical protein ACOYVK_17500 [Bacillota bacterium]
MSEKLKASIGVFWINTVCTLRCKRCITLTPYHKNPINYPKENIFNDIDSFFEIYECIDHFDIEGGESLLHLDLPAIINKAFEYKHCFKRLHILTNGTVVPSQQLIDSCKNREIFFIVDDYGDLSNKKAELVDILEKNNIEYRVDKYYGEDQYFNGWVDFGDMKHKNYTAEEIQCVFNNCRQAQISAPYIKDGKIFLCSIQAARIEYIPLIEGEYIDLTDKSVTLDERRNIARNFGKRPLSSCKFCQGFDAENGQRYPAAEQLLSKTDEELKICL